MRRSNNKRHIYQSLSRAYGNCCWFYW